MKTKASYQVVTKKDSGELAKFISKDGQLPMLDLISQAEIAVDELIDVTANAIGLRGTLRRCGVTTNLIESPQSGVRMRTRRVTR